MFKGKCPHFTISGKKIAVRTKTEIETRLSMGYNQLRDEMLT